MSLSIIIPCYNEEKIIRKSYQRLREIIPGYCSDYELIFVNDGSTDQTLEELKKIKLENEKVKIISYFPNRGPGYAYQQLYWAAEGEAIIQMDADLSMDPKETIPKFLEYLEEYEIIIGSRYLGIKPDYPLRRLIPSKIYHALNKLLFNLDIKDTQSGFFAFRKEALKSVKCTSNGFEIHLELFHKLKKKGFKFKEIPIKFKHSKESGETNILISGPKMFFNTLKVWKKYR